MSRNLATNAAISSPTINSRVIIIGLHAIGLLLLALHVYVRTLPPTPEPIPAPTDAEAAWWGLWPVTYVPAFWFWFGVAVVLATFVGGWGLLLRWHDRTERFPLGWLYVISTLLLIAFYLFPIVHTRWGDAYILSQAIAWPDPALRLTHSWQAPLDVFLHSQFWLALSSLRDWEDAMLVYHLLSPLAGLIYLVILLQFAADQEFAPGWLTYGLMASLGLMQLFFGYVENYSFAAAGILAYLWLGWRVLQERSPLWLAALVLGLTNATHPSTIVLGPSLLYVAWIRWRQGTTSVPRSVMSSARSGGIGNAVRIAMETALPLLIIAGGTLVLMEAGGHGLVALLTTDRPGGGDASWFVPLWGTRTRWEAYTLLSWLHLRDLLNQMLLVAPVVLPSLLWIGLAARRTVSSEQIETRRFLAIAALAHLLLITIWNPDYGGQRDWDLFSLAWIPTTLWLVSLARAKLEPITLTSGFVPLLVLQALHTAVWIYQNTLPWTWP